MDPKTPEERKQAIEEWKNEGKITSAKIRLPIEIQVWSFDSGRTVPNSIWGKVEEYVGLRNVPFQIDGNNIRTYLYSGTGTFYWDGVQGFYGNKPTYFEIPIDLAVEAEGGRGKGGDSTDLCGFA